MADIKWIKLSTEIFNNRKIRQMQNLPQGDTLLVIWIKLLVLAGQINDGGAVYITPAMGYSIETLAAEFQRPVAAVKLAMDCFVQFGMAEVDEGGIITVCGWEKHQNVDGMERVREQNRIRQREYYYRQKALKASAGIPNARLTPPHAPEEEREEEKEKEIHSFVRPREEDAEWKQDQRVRLGGELGRNVVLLSDEQLEDLLEQLSLEEFDRYVAIVADNELSGKHYTKKTHYQAILDMAKKDRRVARKGGGQ